MRVALVALEREVAAQLAAWLGDEGHLPRRFESVMAFAGSDDLALVAAVFATGRHSAAVAAALPKGCRLIVIGTDGVAADAQLDKPLRRRSVLAALGGA